MIAHRDTDSSYHESMLRYHAAYYLPKGEDKMVVAEVLDFPGVCSQGFDLADARVMIASALEDLAQLCLEEGSPYPLPVLVWPPPARISSNCYRCPWKSAFPGRENLPPNSTCSDPVNHVARRNRLDRQTVEEAVIKARVPAAL